MLKALAVRSGTCHGDTEPLCQEEKKVPEPVSPEIQFRCADSVGILEWYAHLCASDPRVAPGFDLEFLREGHPVACQVEAMESRIGRR